MLLLDLCVNPGRWLALLSALVLKHPSIVYGFRVSCLCSSVGSHSQVLFLSAQSSVSSSRVSMWRTAFRWRADSSEAENGFQVLIDSVDWYVAGHRIE